MTLVAVKKFKLRDQVYLPGMELPDDAEQALDSRQRWLLLDQRMVELHVPEGQTATSGGTGDEWPRSVPAAAQHSFPCPDCKKGFTTRRGMRYHRKNIHGKED